MVFADEHRLLGEIGWVLQPRDGAPVNAQVVVDLAGVVRVDELDDRFELDVSDDRQHHEDANRDEAAPHEPAHEPHEGPGQTQQCELQLAVLGTFHRFPSIWRHPDTTDKQRSYQACASNISPRRARRSKDVVSLPSIGLSIFVTRDRNQSVVRQGSPPRSDSRPWRGSAPCIARFVREIAMKACASAKTRPGVDSVTELSRNLR